MNPGSPSRHPSEAEEEDSPLQQSAQGIPQWQIHIQRILHPKLRRRWRG
jgi:hypothetical protein